MKSPSLHSLTLAVCAISVGSSAARADIIFYTNSQSLGTEAMYFSDPLLAHSGLLFQGNFVAAGLGYVMNFTSSSGNGLLTGTNVAPYEVEGLAGNDPLTALSFSLSESTEYFTKAVFDVDAATSGSLSISVLEMNGTSNIVSFAVAASGENFFTVEAINGQTIRSITLSGTDGFNSVGRLRFGGFGGREIVSNVPDASSTVMLLGGTLALLSFARRRL
jgi:hypothetical protein